MRINHNIASLNTYRQLSANSATGARSLEKLSSGLRINKAGDDAAGLAISEKMRGQIRGLDQASRNAQDGISMIQTAEGALSETQSILQRMKELATQSANGTNTASDRGEIQKEINQLSSEINRIGNTTEFNTQKLLNGGKQISANATASAAALKGGQAVTTSNATALNVSTGATAVAGIADSGNIDLTADVTGTSTFSYNGVTVHIALGADDNTTFDTGRAIVAAGATSTDVTINLATGDALLDDDAFIRNSVMQAFNAQKAVAGSANADITFAATGISGISARGTLAQGATLDAVAFTSANITGSIANATAGAQHSTGTGKAGVTGVAAETNITFSTIAAVPSEGSSFILADKKIAVWDSSTSTFASAAQAKEALGADFVVDRNGVAANDGAAFAAKVVTTVGASGIGGFTLSSAGAVLNLEANSPGKFQGINLGAVTANIATATAASGKITLTAAPADGSSITIDGQKIGFYDSSLGVYSSDTAAATGMTTNLAVDTKGKTVSEIADSILALQTSINTVATNDVNLSKQVNTDGSVDINVTAQTAGFGGNTVGLDVSKTRTSGFDATFQIGANTAQSMTFSAVDMRSQALNVTGNVSGASITTASGVKASYVATANVTDGTTNSNVEYALDVSSSDKATAAISVIGEAIEAVSAERSKMGAYQNRLEHTINNLGTSSENLTAAESRIRDVDMAKEMMEFTKNNILSQAAQAMLAQANQQPQGVLQLLR